MTRCEFLTYEKSKSCSGCTGWFCLAKGRKKKVGDAATCNDEELWSECTRYLQVYPKPPDLEIEPIIEFSSTETFNEPLYLEDVLLEDEIIDIPKPTPPKPKPLLQTCPYLGPPPPGVRTCCGLYCYAENVAVRTGTTCHSRPSWRECVKRLRAVKRGVKHAVGHY